MTMLKKFPMVLNLQMFAATATELLQELYTERSGIHSKQSALLAKAEEEKRDLTEDEEKEYEGLENKFLDLEEKIKATRKKSDRENLNAARESALNEFDGKPFRPALAFGAPTQEKKLDDAGFKNIAEFVDALRFGDAKGRVQNLPLGQGQGGGRQLPEAFAQQIMRVVRNEFSMGTSESGGIMVPEQFRPEILQIRGETAIVRPRALVLPAGDPPDSKITMPALTQGSKGVYGGVEVKWIGEGDAKPNTNATLREVSLQPEEAAATMTVTDKLLRNWDAADVFIRTLLTNAMRAAEDIAFLRGDGVGKPMGVIGAAGELKVNRTTANQVKYLDIVNMVAKLLPESVSNAIFIANQSLLPQLATMQDPAGNYIFIQGDVTRGIPSTLFGIPLRFTGKTPTLGNKGDLILVDFSYYLIKDGSGPFIAASEHVLFQQNKTVIKAFWNVDGEPWVVEPLTLEDGVTQVSPYVSLDVPA